MTASAVVASQSWGRLWARALQLTFPIFFAYFPLGVVFGLVFIDTGYAWYWAPIMSTVIYAGSVQFMALSALVSGVSLIQIAAASVVLCIRNAVYGLSFLERYPRNFWKRVYLIFGLADATYTILTYEKGATQKDDERFCLLITGLHHAYWSLGTLVGAYLGASLVVPEGLEFALTALFTVMTLDYLRDRVARRSIVIAALSGAIAWLIWPAQLLALGLGLSTLILLSQGDKS